MNLNGAHKIILKSFIERIESTGLMPWQRGWHKTGPAIPVNMASKRPYSGLNAIMLMAAGDTPYWISKTELEKRGGQTYKDAKPFLVYGVFKKQIKGKVDSQGNPVYDWCRRFTKAYNVSDCSGIKLPTYDAPNLVESIPHIEALIKEHDIDIRQTTAHDQAFYKPSSDYIAMPSQNKFKCTGEYYKTLMHEVTHWTGNRLERDMSGHGGDHAYSYEELVAEITASFLCAHFGITSESIQDNSAAYVKGWCKKLGNHKEWIFKAGSDAQKAFDFIIKPAV